LPAKLPTLLNPQTITAINSCILLLTAILTHWSLDTGIDWPLLRIFLPDDGKQDIDFIPEHHSSVSVNWYVQASNFNVVTNFTYYC